MNVRFPRETLKALRAVGVIRPRFLGWVEEPDYILAPIISASLETRPGRWYAVLWDGIPFSELDWQKEDPRLSYRPIGGGIWR